MKFSIIIVTYNRKNELAACLASIAAQKSSLPFEIVIIYNGETSYVEKMRNLYPSHVCHLIKTSTPAHARNVGIGNAKGEYLFFLDDDCYLPPDYFSFIDFTSDWEVFGGPDRTPPVASTLQKLIGFAISSPFCMGPTFKRHSSFSKAVNQNSGESELILCNLWIKKNIFVREGHTFEESLFRNEENYLLKELKIEHKKIYYNPKVFVYHSRKTTLEKLAYSIIKSGESRVQNYLKMPLRSELIYFCPILFNLLFMFWIFNPFSNFKYLFLGYVLATYLYGICRLKTFQIGFTGLHFFILFFYSFGLIRELQNQSFKCVRKIITSYI
ncbi:MAG: glycosyltransferase [Bacteriovorax sp.]|nr:glycosyltransferase [Bacteriovorax sp.]